MKLTKTLNSLLLGAAFAVGAVASAQAATLNNQGSLTFSLDNIASTSTPSSYKFDYLDGGLVTFNLNSLTSVAQNDNEGRFKLTISTLNGTQVFLQNLLENTPFSLALAANTYVISLASNGNQNRTVANLTVSAVPLPGAALLFGSGLLGFLGFSKRRKG